ncbi:NTP transferase domain-containing protein [Kordiimonas sp. SCSIO 12610]|uniref:NTP transferase domain-containing protein n=1 Tax=Kordiimonas sp. SCSIO 12610 TaxID=2829597 RepID=UPI00210F20C5|nr:molybdopterin-binding/glycosyltransferase family 2 protein [Kordiimonas sp. SCSIO 12610]UTW56623.1 molybdopterin-binding/glycosyltransferase family 2 protein [Kordiimonas sp. SCSIO 12610]
MKFEFRNIDDCQGWKLAHSITTSNKKVKKATEITAEHIRSLKSDGVEKIQVFKLDNFDIDENSAAANIADHLIGANTRRDKSTRGRCNIKSTCDGLIQFSSSMEDINFIDEAITLATLANFQPVKEGQLIATVKIIPYAVDKALLNKATLVTDKLNVAPFRTYNCALISSDRSLPPKAISIIENRVNTTHGCLKSVDWCDHNVEDLSAKIISTAMGSETDLILLTGISAISDRRDIIPSALIEAGGTIEHLGMPVDPGNLLMLGTLNGKMVIGLPSCAKSPALNGFDWVLARFAAGLQITAKDIKSMGLGGLLKEDRNRPSPRLKTSSGDDIFSNTKNNISTVVLAAGKSSRAQRNKLLASLGTMSVLERTLSLLTQSDMIEEDQILLVTGHEHDKIKSLIANDKIKICYNAKYTEGMSESLKLANKHIREETEFVLIALGDMPFVRPQSITTLIKAGVANPEYQIIIPTFHGKRGNPVLWNRDKFYEIRNISADQGGRKIIKNNEDYVLEVEIDDPGLLIDLDTPEMLEQFGLR